MDYLHAGLLVMLVGALVSMTMSGAGRRWATRHIFDPLRAGLNNRSHVETLRDAVLGLAGLGTTVGAIFGYSQDSSEAYLLGLVLAMIAALVVTQLSRLLSALQDREDATRHRKTAGTVRSIVRGELQAAAAAQRQRRLRSVRSGPLAKNRNGARANLNGSRRSPTIKGNRR